MLFWLSLLAVTYIFNLLYHSYDLLNSDCSQEHLHYDVVRSADPELKKATIRINIYKQHRQTIQVRGIFQSASTPHSPRYEGTLYCCLHRLYITLTNDYSSILFYMFCFFFCWNLVYIRVLPNKGCIMKVEVNLHTNLVFWFLIFIFFFIYLRVL